MKSFEITGTHFITVDLSRGKGKASGATGKSERPEGPKGKEKGCTPLFFTWIPLHIQKPCGAHTHETKQFPGFGGACLKANSLPPTSDILYIYFGYLLVYFAKFANSTPTTG